MGVETPEIDQEKVESIVEEYGKKLPAEIATNFENLKTNMKFKAPDAYDVEEDTGDQKIRLQHEVDDDKKVKSVALLIAGGKKFKDEVADAVWGGIESDIESKISGQHELAQKAARKGARAASDKASEKACDKLIAKYAKKIEDGEI